MIYYALLKVYIAQRLSEMWLGRRNLRRHESELVSPIDRSEARQMLVLHASWFVALFLEYFWRGGIVAPGVLAGVYLALLVLAQALRVWSIVALGSYWVPWPVSFRGQRRVTSGPYRYLRHPNYLAVVIEFVILPAYGGCWITLTVGTFLNGLFLWRRIRTEEEGLRKLEHVCG